MIKTVIFDWGGVLIDNPADDLQKYCANVLGVEMPVLKNIFSQYEAGFQRGLIAETELWKNICAQMNVDRPKSASLWKEAVQNVFTDKPEVFNLITKLREGGYKLGFLSNTEIPTMEYFLDNQYDKYFDTTVFSCAERLAKPDAAIYSLALERLNAQPSETIYIDDRADYIEAAKKIGINGVVFSDANQLIAELTFNKVTIN